MPLLTTMRPTRFLVKLTLVWLRGSPGNLLYGRCCTSAVYRNAAARFPRKLVLGRRPHGCCLLHSGCTGFLGSWLTPLPRCCSSPQSAVPFRRELALRQRPHRLSLLLRRHPISQELALPLAPQCCSSPSCGCAGFRGTCFLAAAILRQVMALQWRHFRGTLLYGSDCTAAVFHAAPAPFGGTAHCGGARCCF